MMQLPVQIGRLSPQKQLAYLILVLSLLIALIGIGVAASGIADDADTGMSAYLQTKSRLVSRFMASMPFVIIILFAIAIHFERRHAYAFWFFGVLTIWLPDAIARADGYRRDGHSTATLGFVILLIAVGISCASLAQGRVVVHRRSSDAGEPGMDIMMADRIKLFKIGTGLLFHFIGVITHMAGIHDAAASVAIVSLTTSILALCVSIVALVFRDELLLVVVALVFNGNQWLQIPMTAMFSIPLLDTNPSTVQAGMILQYLSLMYLTALIIHDRNHDIVSSSSSHHPPLDDNNQYLIHGDQQEGMVAAPREGEPAGGAALQYEPGAILAHLPQPPSQPPPPPPPPLIPPPVADIVASPSPAAAAVVGGGGVGEAVAIVPLVAHHQGDGQVAIVAADQHAHHDAAMIPSPPGGVAVGSAPIAAVGGAPLAALIDVDIA